MEIGNAYTYWIALDADEMRILKAALDVYMGQNEDDIAPSPWADACEAYDILNSGSDEYHENELEAMKYALEYAMEIGNISGGDIKRAVAMVTTLAQYST